MASWREPLSHLRHMVREDRSKGVTGWSFDDIESHLDVLNDVYSHSELQDIKEEKVNEEVKKKAAIEKITTTLYDKASAYTTLILGVGYTGYFTLWSSFSEKMPEPLRAVSGGAMIFSLSVFIFWEVFKMFVASRQTQRYAQLLLKSGDDYLDEEMKVVNWENRTNKGLQAAWHYVQIATILPALPALGILFYTHVKLL